MWNTQRGLHLGEIEVRQGLPGAGYLEQLLSSGPVNDCGDLIFYYFSVSGFSMFEWIEISFFFFSIPLKRLFVSVEQIGRAHV